MQPPKPKPCKDCPFRRKSMPGWLGAHSVEEFIRRWQSDLPMECHLTVDYESPDKTHLEQIEEGETVHFCTGALIMFANECKLSRDPERPRMEADRKTVFSNRHEFVEHHDTEHHRSFVRNLRKHERD